jgi:hypothetical protein
MHIFFKEIGAFISTVTVEYSKIAAAWPATSEVRFGDIHDD